jgi:hypothetical protein
LVLKPVAALAAIAIVLSNYPVVALGQEAAKPSDRTDCDKLSWSVDRERDWFTDKNLPRRTSGARLRRIDRAVDLSLRPAQQVDLFLPPDVKLRPDSFSGEVTFFGVPRPGFYQVTLSDEATIDVFENGARLKATGFTSAKHCPGVFESMRFELAPGDLVLVEVTNASRSSIKVAFARAEAEAAW